MTNRITGKLIHKDNRYMQFLADFWPDKPISGSGGDSDTKLPQPSEENVGKILTSTQDENNNYIYSLEYPSATSSDIQTLDNKIDDNIGNLAKGGATAQHLWYQTPNVPNFTKIAPNVWQTSGTASQLYINYDSYNNGRVPAFNGVEFINNYRTKNYSKLGTFAIGIQPRFTVTNQEISMSLIGGGMSNVIASCLMGVCYFNPGNRFSGNGQTGSSGQFKKWFSIDFGYFKMIFSWPGVSAELTNNTVITITIVCTGIV